jgi:hypothetical protein
MGLLQFSHHRLDGGWNSAQQSPKVFGLVPGGDSSLSCLIGDTNAIIHVGRPLKQDIEHVPLEMHLTPAIWKLEQSSTITQGV